jgi:hypothetical protein
MVAASRTIIQSASQTNRSIMFDVEITAYYKTHSLLFHDLGAFRSEFDEGRTVSEPFNVSHYTCSSPYH